MRSLQHTQAGARRRQGFTLIEMVISMALFTLVIGIGILVGQAGRNAFMSTSSATQLDARVKSALDRVAMEVEMASALTLDPQLTGLIADTSSLNLQQVVDIQAGAAVLGNLITIDYQRDPGDAVDGVDNDGDGLIDEGRLVLTRDAGGAAPTSVTLCKDVRQFLEGEVGGGGDENGNGLTDEAGFLITRDGDLLTLQLTIEEARANGETIIRTSSTSVVLNN